MELVHFIVKVYSNIEKKRNRIVKPQTPKLGTHYI